MSKSIFLFKINNNFKSLKNENNLDIILDLFLKSKNNDFYQEQYKLIIDKIDLNLIKNNLNDYFKLRKNFFVDDNKLIINNQYKEEVESLVLDEYFIKLDFNENSIFLEYLSLYFIDLIAIEINEEKIYPLHLVKSNILV